MSWQDYYKSRLMSAQDAAKILQSGDCFWFPLLMGQPSMLIPDAIADRKDELKDVEWITCLTLRPYKLFKPEYRDTFYFVSGFYSTPHMQQMAASEWANFIPYQSSDAGAKYSHRKRVFKRRTGIITQVTPPDEHGFVNLGLDTFYTEAIMDQSEWVIAEVIPTARLTARQLPRIQVYCLRRSPNPIIAVPTPPRRM